MRVSRAHRCGAVVLSLLMIGGVTLLTLNALDQQHSRSRLQSMADDAAIEGVLALAANAAKGGNVADRAAAEAATAKIASTVEPGEHVRVRSSSIHSSVAVEISAQSGSWLSGLLSGELTDVTGHATYQGPAQQQAPSANRLRSWQSYAEAR